MVINNNQPLTSGNTNTFGGVDWHGTMSGSVVNGTVGVTMDKSAYNILIDTAKMDLDEDGIDEDRLDKAMRVIKRKIRLAKQ